MNISIKPRSELFPELRVNYSQLQFFQSKDYPLQEQIVREAHHNMGVGTIKVKVQNKA
jgi:hypothetical protein